MKGLKLYLQKLYKNKTLIWNRYYVISFGNKQYKVAIISMKVLDENFDIDYCVNRIQIISYDIQDFIPLKMETWNSLYLHSNVREMLNKNTNSINR